MPTVVISFETTDAPAAVAEAITAGITQAFPAGTLASATDDDLLTHGAALEQVGRLVDARRVEWAGEVGERCGKELGTGSLASRKGCRTGGELLQRVTRVSGVTAARRLKLGADTRPQLSLAGVHFPARFPRVSAALQEGMIGSDAAQAIVAGLTPTLDHVAIDDLAAAETELVAAATGTSPDSPIPASADEVRIQACQWRAYLDPDGIRPSEEEAMTKRGFFRGRLTGGLVHGKYALMPEIAGKLDRLMSAHQSPRTGTVFLTDTDRAEAEAAIAENGADPRNDAQQRHDILAAIIDTAARSGQTPTLGGAAPTVLVSVTSDDLSRNRGVGWIDGVDEPVSLATVKQFICTGGTQTIRFDPTGRIIELGSPQRCFTPAQRKAITLRDGGCIIPGCECPAAWTEIHHVTPDTDGGPTHTDNGVLLCWFHHRSIDTSGWQIRMRNGTPQIKAPPWIHWNAPWRPAGNNRHQQPGTQHT